jgi:hypothetical protein
VGEVELPSYDALLSVPPSKLLEVRIGAGVAYHDILRSQDVSEQRPALVFALKRYCEKLCEVAKDGRPSRLARCFPAIGPTTQTIGSVCALATAIGVAFGEPAKGEFDFWVASLAGVVGAVGLVDQGVTAIANRRRRRRVLDVLVDDLPTPKKVAG